MIRFLYVLHCFKGIQGETEMIGWGCVAVIIDTLFCSIMYVGGIGRWRGLVVRGAGRIIWRPEVQVSLQGHL